MTTISKTAIVYNNQNSKCLGVVPFYYRWRVCDTNLNSNTPANQYQRQKLIQNTVRVYSSLYASNLGPLNAYVQPSSGRWVQTSNGQYHQGGYGVCWNQMSDRPVPSVQKGVIPTGFNSSLNRRHTSVTSSRPGCQAPGGIGCDIKHNSYDRYLNRIKGKGPLRRGVVPPTFGLPIPFNPAFPVYGGKTVKTNIVTGCDCPIQNNENNVKQDIKIYDNPLWQPDPVSILSFSVGDYVYAIETGNKCYSRAIIISISNGIYTVEFDNGNIQTVPNSDYLLVYFPCNCNGTTYENGCVCLNNVNNSFCLFPEISTSQNNF
jgi:hypothetical protein